MIYVLDRPITEAQKAAPHHWVFSGEKRVAHFDTAEEADAYIVAHAVAEAARLGETLVVCRDSGAA